MFYIIGIHFAEVTVLQFCMTWLAYEFSISHFSVPPLIMHQQHLGCLKYSSFSQILHNHIALSFSVTTCTNTPVLLRCIKSSPFCFIINIVCIRMRVFLTCEEYHKSSYFSINVFVYLVNFCFTSFLDVMLLYES